MTSNLYSSSENPNTLASSVSAPTQSVEEDAQRLMDDLFSDIDRILDGGSRLPSEPIHPDYIALKSVVVPPIIMPPPADESALMTQRDFGKTGNGNIPPHQNISHYLDNNSPKKGWSYSLDKILFIIACLSLVGVVGWLIYQKRIPLPFLTQTDSQTVGINQNGNNPQITPEDQQFIAYMLRSLELIDQQTINTPTPTATPIPNLPDNVKIPPISNPTNTNQPQTVIERIYIPYPSSQTPSNTNNNTTTPLPLPPPAPAPSNSTPAPAVTPTPLPLPTPQNSPNLDFNVPPAPLPGVTHTLVGLLEAGDNSAALFDVNGSTQRIKVGEQIGTSGWALVSVASQQAVIRRNGEVRSIYVGQKF